MTTYPGDFWPDKASFTVTPGEQVTTLAASKSESAHGGTLRTGCQARGLTIACPWNSARTDGRIRGNRGSRRMTCEANTIPVSPVHLNLELRQPRVFFPRVSKTTSPAAIGSREREMVERVESA